MTLIVVLDVNILASAAATPTGLPAHIADLGLVWEAYTMVVSAPLIKTLNEVLQRPYFVEHMSPEAKLEFLDLIDDRARKVEVKGAISGIADDAEDDAIIETAIAGNADMIVTGDKGLLRLGEYRGVCIVTAAKFLDLVRERTREDTP